MCYHQHTVALPGVRGTGRFNGPYSTIHVASTSSYAVGSANADVSISSTPVGGVIASLNVLAPSPSATPSTYTLTIDGTSSAITFPGNVPISYPLNIGFNSQFKISCSSGSGSALLTYTTYGGTTILRPALLNYAPTVLADLPVAYWRMDTPSGTSVTDVTGNGNTGTISGGVTLSRPGATSDGDTAMAFDGSSGSVSAGDPAGLRLTSTGTLECWVKPSAWTAVYYGIAGKGNGGPGTNVFAFYTNPSFNLQVNVSGAAFNPVTAASDVRTSVPVGLWTHLVGTWDGTTIRTYINGAPGPTGAQTGNPNTTGFNMLIGQATGIGFFNGSIDEVAIYNYALTAAQVQAHYNAAFAVA